MTEASATGRLVEIDGVDHYRIDGSEHMEPFLMSVVSDSDLWMFVSSTGNLTAGRIDADHAILPYETDDRIHRQAGVSGPVTLIARADGSSPAVWAPFGRDLAQGCTRSISKSVLGNRIVFEEHNPTWGLVFRSSWSPSPALGWVRRTELVDLSGTARTFDVIDGLVDVMPAGVDARTEQLTSNLVDAYKRSETGRWGTSAFFTLVERIRLRRGRSRRANHVRISRGQGTNRAPHRPAWLLSVARSRGIGSRGFRELDDRCRHRCRQARGRASSCALGVE